MTARALPLFAASIVGSMPRPAFVRAPLALPEDSPVRRARLDAAVPYVVALQEAAGLDVVSDGEWRRRSYIGVIAEIMDGFAREPRDGLSWHTVVEPMRARRPGLLGEEARFLVGRASRATKVALPSPYLLAQRMWDPEASAAALGHRGLLVIQGGEDARMPREGAEAIARAGGKRAKVWLVPGAGHLEAYAVDEAQYLKRLVEFFKGELR